MAIIGTDITLAQKYLERGELVAIPTETVYGLAANALNEKAVSLIFEAKNRPTFDPLIIHTHSIESISHFVTEIHPSLLQLAKAFWPGPLTLLLPKKKIISDLVTSGLDRVGVRIPNHALTLKLLKALHFPLAAPSANPFGYISPTSATHVNNQLGNKIPYILDGGNCDIGIESTIVGEENGEIIIYRLGGLSVDAIEQVVGKVAVQLNQSSNPKAPGQLKSHYAPRKLIFISPNLKIQPEWKQKKMGCLSFGNAVTDSLFLMNKNLSLTKNYKEAAINLFAFLRELDESDVDMIVTDLLPEENLGIAINDRLRRATSNNNC